MERVNGFRCSLRLFSDLSFGGGLLLEMVTGSTSLPVLITCFLLFLVAIPNMEALSLSSVSSDVQHLQASPPTDTVDSLATNEHIHHDGTEERFWPSVRGPRIQREQLTAPVLVLIHEFFGLSQSICDKAQKDFQMISRLRRCGTSKMRVARPKSISETAQARGASSRDREHTCGITLRTIVCSIATCQAQQRSISPASFRL